MKNLFIIRHAKSSWSDISLDDFDRPLNKRGKSNAPCMGQILKQKGIVPDIIISSPARRAKDTANIIANEIGYKKDIVYENSIYEANVFSLHSIIKNIDDSNKSAFVFGHNPGLNMLVEDYIEFYENIPTTGIIHIEFLCDSWSDIDSSNATLIEFDYPKKHSK